MRLPEYTLKVRMNYWLTRSLAKSEMLGILRRHKTDLLHVQCVSSNAHYALMARHALGLPLIVTSQGERTMDAGRSYERSPYMNLVMRRVLAEANHITACSKNTFDDLELYCGSQFGKRGGVIYNGICADDFHAARAYTHAKPYILGIGRMVPQKGFDVLIEAFAKAGLQSHDLLIAGEGPERNTLEQLSQKHGLTGSVHFIGRADRETAASLFKGCSFFVLPSRQEPMGIVNLEAMASGKAVIASRTGGVPEIVIENETGLLVPPADATALAEALRRLADNDLLRARLGMAGEKRAENFTWAAIANSYRHIYEKALTEKRRAQSNFTPTAKTGDCYV
jgi:glycogen synthase